MYKRTLALGFAHDDQTGLLVALCGREVALSTLGVPEARLEIKCDLKAVGDWAEGGQNRSCQWASSISGSSSSSSCSWKQQ